jgi:hypothetical protein
MFRRIINESKIIDSLFEKIEKNNKMLWRLAWRVFLMLFLIFGVLGSITGWNIYGLINQLSNQVNIKIEKQFEEPTIKKTVEQVAKTQSKEILEKNIYPFVANFKDTINLELNRLKLYQNRINLMQSRIYNTLKNIDSMMVIINNTSNEILESRNRILKIETDLKIIREMARPNSIVLADKKINNLSNGKQILLQFEPTKNEPLGVIQFKIYLLDNSSTKILDIWPSLDGGGFTAWEESKKIDPNGESAVLTYGLIGAGAPLIEITISGPSKLRVEGNYLSEPIMIIVK